MIYLIPALFSLGFILWRLMPIEGMVGHDYSHYYTRLFIGVDHFIKNGFSVPHFTPYLCGGVPYFADPQIYFYSLPQLLSFFISPFVATYFSYAVFYVLGYWGMFRLCSEFKLNPIASHIGALAFLLNGFSFAHLFVGHANHYQFLLLPWLILFPLRAIGFYSKNWWRDISLFSFCIIYCFYSGAMHILVVAFAMLSLFLPSLIYLKKREGELKSFVMFFVVVFIVLVLTCSGKLMASYLYSPNFAIHGVDRSEIHWFVQTLRYFWFNPDTTPSFIRFGQWAFGPWEYVGFISRLSVLALLCLFFLMRRYSTERWVLITTILIAVFWLSIANGFPLNDALPFFKSYHNPLKLLGGFVVPLLLVWAWGIEQFTKHPRVSRVMSGNKLNMYFLLCGILLCEYAINTAYFIKSPGTLGYRYHPEAYTLLKQKGGFPAVQEVSNQAHGDLSEALAGRSSLSCYEPLFGYRLEKFASRLMLGKADSTFDDALNLNHPGCLVYGATLGCKAWDRIETHRLDLFERFRKGQMIAEWVPAWQSTLIGINLCFILILFLPLVMPRHFWKPRIRLKHPLEVET